MKNFFNAASAALINAWKKQMDIPLPPFLRDFSGEPGVFESAAFPLLGWLIALAAIIPGSLVAAIFTPLAGALTFAICAWLLLTFRDSGRSDSMIANIIAASFPGNAIPWRITVPVMLMIIKFIMLTAIFYCGNGWHLTLVTGTVFAMEALLTSDGKFMPPLLDNSPASRRMFWITAAVLLFISFLCCRLPAALAALAFAVLWKIFQNRTENNGGTTLAEISLAGGITGWISIIAGVLAI